MSRTRISALPVLVSTLALLALLAGCRINVDKDANGKDKRVQIDTPFGGIHVDTDKTTALDVGLPLYPGAQLVNDDNHKSADVHMGFGDWKLRVRAVSYTTPDSRDKVIAFYKKALGNYGNVIACQDDSPVGQPTATAEGLTCSEKNHANVHIDDKGESYGYHSGSGGFQLKAGSERHQHIVGFESAARGQTRFSLVALDLPVNPDSHSGQSD